MILAKSVITALLSSFVMAALVVAVFYGISRSNNSGLNANILFLDIFFICVIQNVVAWIDHLIYWHGDLIDIFTIFMVFVFVLTPQKRWFLDSARKVVKK